MKRDWKSLCIFKVNTQEASDIKDKYADGGSKPYFKFYKNGTFQEEIKYKKPWSDQKPSLEDALRRYSDGGGASFSPSP